MGPISDSWLSSAEDQVQLSLTLSATLDTDEDVEEVLWHGESDGGGIPTFRGGKKVIAAL